MLFPLVKADVEVMCNTREATQGWEERLVASRGVQKLIEIVRGIDSYGAVFELCNIVSPV